MEEPLKPRRRWFRFSLRTMLVLVTLLCPLCGYLGWAMNWIYQRHKFFDTPSVYDFSSISTPVHAPIGLRILGERGVGEIVSEINEEADFVAASSLFPEAKIYVAHISKDGVYFCAESVNSLELLSYYQNGKLFREHLLFVPIQE